MDWTETFDKARENLLETSIKNYLILRIPSDTYTVKFDSVELKTRTSAPAIPYFTIRMRIVGGDFAGYILSDIIGIGPEHAKIGLSRVMALAAAFSINTDNIKSPEELAMLLNESLPGIECKILAVKSKGQKAVINYLIDETDINYPASDISKIDFNDDEVPF